MNKHDRSQLDYILSLSDEDFDTWAMELTDDDLQYALELIKAARAEAELQEIELMDKLENSDFAEAREVLKRFTLGA